MEKWNENEVNYSGPSLMAVSKLIGKYCDPENDEFILCKARNSHPAMCVEEGKKVTLCTLQVFKRIEEICKLEFDEYANCLNYGHLKFVNCRKPYSNKEDLFFECLRKNNYY